jgi:hypothetical protein
VVAGDFIGHHPVFLIAGDSEKRQLFHVVRGGKERNRREEGEKKKRRRGGKADGYPRVFFTSKDASSEFLCNPHSCARKLPVFTELTHF